MSTPTGRESKWGIALFYAKPQIRNRAVGVSKTLVALAVKTLEGLTIHFGEVNRLG